MASLWAEFLNPGASWRGLPFWSWNGELDEDELLRQVRVMKAMGLGGFFMHSRTGLQTEYLGAEWYRLTNACADLAAELGMEAWLYDEDRWPSGTAGGLVTENPKHRARFISLELVHSSRFRWSDDLLAAFACRLDGVIYTELERLDAGSALRDLRGRTVLAFRVEEMARSSFYNGFTYVDTLSRAATNEFLKRTHEQYRARCGERLGTSIRGIFTDEPHRGPLMCGFGLSNARRTAMAPWTPKLLETFTQRYGYDLIGALPELFLVPESGPVQPVKWQYVELLQQLFLENWARPIHAWCDQHGLRLTGHALHEDSLTSQTAMQGSLMRFYEHQHDPGVDVLTEGNRAYWIVKQLASAARQLGQTRLLSELYGCTGWQMTFAGHKAVGDWQALFGINLRCHHLSWYTMAGEAKRDYPASILHQSAWWSDYNYVETYFARLGLVLSQGQPCCDLLVLNPVESVWCQVHAGWADGLSPQTDAVRALEAAYAELFHTLAGAQFDFDYGDEEMLGRLGQVVIEADGTPRLELGQMRYRAVVVPAMTTVRGSTLDLLERFVDAGGPLLFSGEAPQYVDAQLSVRADDLSDRATRCNGDRAALRAACAAVVGERVEVVDAATGEVLESSFCQLRADGDARWLVALNVDRERGWPAARVRLHTAGGSLAAAEWDCRAGEAWQVDTAVEGDALTFATDFAPAGERVWRLTPAPEEGPLPRPALTEVARETLAGPYAYTLAEPNVCVLDTASWRVDEAAWQEPVEILKVDRAVRAQFGLPARGGEMVQPWYRDKFGERGQEMLGVVDLRFEFEVEQVPDGVLRLALETPERFRVRLNGRNVPTNDARDWWVDTALRKVVLPNDWLQPGANELTLSVAFAPSDNLEAVYLLGNFGVRLDGETRVLGALPATLAAGDLTGQGLPFYGGALTYRLPVSTPPGAGQRAILETPSFEAALLKAGPPATPLAFAPFEADVTAAAAAGEIQLEAVLTRRNTFGPLHQVPLRAGAYGPGNWTTDGAGFARAPQLWPSGLLAEPTLRLVS